MQLIRVRSLLAWGLISFACSVKQADPNGESNSGGTGNTAGARAVGGNDAAQAGETGTAPGASGATADGGSAGESGADGVGLAGNAGADAGAGNEGGAGGEVGSGHDAELSDLPHPTSDAIGALTVAGNFGLGLAATTDGGGNSYFTQRGNLVKCDPAMQQLWSVALPSYFSVTSLAASLSGEIYATGYSENITGIPPFPGESAAGGSDVGVAKFSTQGGLLWLHQFGTSVDDQGDAVRVLSDGSLIVLGVSAGQLPMQPAASAGQKFLLAYDSAGNRTAVHQVYGGGNDHWFGASVDSTGNVYARLGNELDLSAPTPSGDYLKLGPDGTPLWKRTNLRATGDRLFESVVAHPQGKLLFAVGSPANACKLYQINAADGAINWHRTSAAPRTVVFEPNEGVTQTGEFVECSRVAVSQDSVYVAGLYRYTYANGSTPRPEQNTLFIARYDLGGSSVWFKQIQINGLSVRPASLEVDSNGDPVFSGPRSSPYPGPNYAVKLHASTGAVF